MAFILLPGRFVSLVVFASLALGSIGSASAADTGKALVEVPALRSASFLGMVSLTPGIFERQQGGYKASYKASVLGIFYREHGTVYIDLDDAALARLVPGTRVDFTGHALANDGGTRRIKGYAEADDNTAGKIKIRIAVTKSIELSFSGPYRFKTKEPAPAVN